MPKVSEIFLYYMLYLSAIFGSKLFSLAYRFMIEKSPIYIDFFVTHRIRKDGAENRYTLSIHIELIISSARDRAIVLLIAPCLIMYWWIWIRICCIYFLHESGSLIQQEDGILHTPSSGFSALTNAGHMYSLLLRL